jgi:phosphatidylserine decarboxylase
MSEQTTDNIRVRVIPGLDEEALPLLSIGLGLTGLTLGLKPRFAPVPLALTALTALLYRDPERTTPEDTGTMFAAADGMVLHVGECYEHRYLHTDAIRIATVMSPLNVPVCRSPATGTVQYLEHVPGDYRSTRNVDAAEYNTRTYIGIKASWGPFLVLQVASPLARRIVSHVETGDQVQAGERISTARFGARTDLFVQRDTIRPLINEGHRLMAGVSRMAHVVPL